MSVQWATAGAADGGSADGDGDEQAELDAISRAAADTQIFLLVMAGMSTRAAVARQWQRLSPPCNRDRATIAAVRILLIEDDAELAETIALGLRREQFAVDLAFDGADGLDRALITAYDVIVLDRDLPGLHGDEVCAALLAAGCRSRVLMLTAAGTIEDLVDGLGRGADDYLAKPFRFAELVARLRALLRRAQPAVPPVLASGDVLVDPARRYAARGGRRLDLGPKEFAVLELLLAAQGRVVSAEELLERVWDEAADPFTTAVKVTVSRLRRKLGDPPVVQTVAQAGYRIGTAR
jgi:DNA-binding response OmpR family regulator